MKHSTTVKLRSSQRPTQTLEWRVSQLENYRPLRPLDGSTAIVKTQDGILYPGTVADTDLDPNSDALIGSFGVTIDGGGQVIATGASNYITLPYDGTIVGWYLMADQVGSISIDIRKCIYGNFPPVALDSICGGNYPFLTMDSKNQNGNPVGWTKAITAGDIVEFIVVGTPSLVQKVNLVVKVAKL